MAGSAVWIDVLPSMGKFSSILTRDATASAMTAGASAGKSFDAGLASTSSKGSAIKSALGGLADAAGTATKVVAGGVLGIGAAIGGLSAKNGLNRLLDIDTAQSKLKGLGHDVDGIATIMESALGSVRGTAFGLGDAATVAASAVAAGIKPGQDLTKYLSLTADAATIAGTSLGEMGSIINKTTSTGKVYTDNLNQLADRGIPIFQWLQEEYGTSAEGLSKMVKEGKVDAETFRRVIEENIGGAALASGNSVRGSFANVGAAFGRLGAQFLKGPVSAAPMLFTSVMGAVDRASAALTPFSDALGTKVVAGLTSVAGWIDRLDFQKIVDGIGGVYSLVVKGDFTSAFASAFGVSEDSKMVDFLFDVRDGITGIWNLVVGGDFTGALQRAFGIEEDAPIVDFVFTVRDAFGQMWASIGQGDLSGVRSGFDQLMTAGGPLGEVLGGLSGGFGSIVGAVGELFASALPLLPALIGSISDIVGFLGEHTEIITPLILALAAGFVIYKQSQVAANAAAVAGLPIRIASTAADIARTIALNNSTKATLLSMGIERASTRTRILATGSITAATVATTGFSLAQRAGAIASGIAAVAMRGLGAAVRFALGPIGIIITVLGLLVAGVVWAYQNVGWFRDGVNSAFAGIMTAVHALGDAASWLWENALKPAWDAIASGATWLWQTVLAPAFDGIGQVFQVVGGLVMTYIGAWVSVFQAIGSAATWLWQNIIAPAFSGIAAVVSFNWAVISAVFDLIVHVVRYVVGGAFSWLYETVIRPVFGWIVDRVTENWAALQLVFGFLVSFVRFTLGLAFTWLYETIVRPVFDGIASVISFVWNSLILPVFTALSGFVTNTLGPIFTYWWQNVVIPVWDGVRAKISEVWDKYIRPVFEALSGVVRDDLPKAFETGRDAIGKAWDGLKELAKVPIKFVVDTIINDGLIGNFNKVADFFGSKTIPKLKLPSGFAGGGVIPGYQAQKRDDVMMPMRRGEGVLVPEVVRALGPGFVHSLNAVGNRGGIGAVRKFAHGDGLAEGGIVGGAIDWIRDAAGAVNSFVSDPAGSFSKVLANVTSAIPGAEGLVSMAKGATSKLVEAAVAAVRKMLPAAGSVAASGPNGSLPIAGMTRVPEFRPGPGVGASGGYLRSDAARAWMMASAASGGRLSLTEGYRDLAAQQYRWSLYQAGGNLAARPGTSNHGNGLAADIGSAGQAWLAKNGPRYGWYPTGLSFRQREPWHFDYKGAATAGMSEGGVITPTLYDKGGVLPQGVSVIANRTRKPEFALPEGKLIDVVRRASADGEGSGGPLIGGDLVLQSTGDTQSDLDAVTFELRRFRRGGK